MKAPAWCLGILFSLIWLTCSPRLSVKFANTEDVAISETSTLEGTRFTPCLDALSYAPDTIHPEFTPTRYIRVNFHFMNSSDGKYNMPKEETSDFVKEWVYVLNKDLEINQKMRLPVGNNTPALPKNYRYVLSPDPNNPDDNGIYYHVDDELCFFVKQGRNRNNTDMRVVKKYSFRKDSVLNIFVMTHHLDSITSQKYRADASGIALGTVVKVAGVWYNKPNAWSLRGITNHEIGHVLGLSHTWASNDGCDDTPRHPNCWNYSTKPPCDSLHSNNMMDYNAHQSALTPCQLGRINKNFSKLNSRQRKLLVPTWCELREERSITISDKDITWFGAKDLDGHLVIDENASLTIKCRVSFPKNGKLIIKPGGKLILDGAHLHNSCGDQWEGIEIQSLGKTSGEIETTGNYKIEDTSISIFQS